MDSFCHYCNDYIQCNITLEIKLWYSSLINISITVWWKGVRTVFMNFIDQRIAEPRRRSSENNNSARTGGTGTPVKFEERFWTVSHDGNELNSVKSQSDKNCIYSKPCRVMGWGGYPSIHGQSYLQTSKTLMYWSFSNMDICQCTMGCPRVIDITVLHMNGCVFRLETYTIRTHWTWSWRWSTGARPTLLLPECLVSTHHTIINHQTDRY